RPVPFGPPAGVGSTRFAPLTAHGRRAITAAMANLSAAEFGQAIGALADQLGVERLRDRLARMNAFTSRRGLNTAAAIADRLYTLSGGLRRQTVTTFAFTSLWQELVGAKIGEDG